MYLAITLLQSVFISYLIMVKPHEGKNNLFDIINELTLTVMIYFMFCHIEKSYMGLQGQWVLGSVAQVMVISLFVVNMAVLVRG